MEQTKENKDEILLYLHNYSFYSQKVLLVLNEKKLQFKTHFINIANGEQYSDFFLAINPRGEVPAIKINDSIVCDSLNIINYLEEKYTNDEHPRIIPIDETKDVHDRLHNKIHALPADVITVGAFVHNDVTGRSKLPFILPVRRHMKNITQTASTKVKAIAEKKTGNLQEVLLDKSKCLEKLWDNLEDRDSFMKVLDDVDKIMEEIEEQLGKNEGTEKWLISEEFTLADIGLTTLLERLNVLGLERRFWLGKRAKITEYFNRVKKRDCYKKSTPTALFHLKTLVTGVTYLTL